MPATDAATARLVADRLTFGATRELVADVRRRGVAAFVEEQLDPATIDDGRLDALLVRYPLLRADHRSMVAVAQRPEPYGQVLHQVRAATVLRAWLSRRQLLERMVDVWSNHLNVHLDAEDVWWAMPIHDRDVIRRHALGRFEDLLLASARSTAMLQYLDNAQSYGHSPNENYARELLELHTVGVAGGFTQRDVEQAALVFTGWTFDVHGFTFVPQWHHGGPLRVLGWSTPGRSGPGAVDDGVSLLRYLARHPATARRVAVVLVRRFVADDPPTSLVDEVAADYARYGTAVAPLIRRIASSPAFLGSGGRKVRRPFDHVVGMLRAVAAQPAHFGAAADDAASTLYTVLGRAGQLPHGWAAPDGFPDTADAWTGAGSLVTRWNAATQLVGNQLPGIAVDLAAVIGTPTPSSAGALVDRIATVLLTHPPDAALRAALLGYVGLAAEAPMSAAAAAAAAPGLAALVLSSPRMVAP